MKTIQFVAQNEETFKLEEAPKPAKMLTPTWFKEAPKWQSKSKRLNKTIDYIRTISFRNEEQVDNTYKMCVPLLDTMTSGYMITLPATLIVGLDIGEDYKSLPILTPSAGWELYDTVSTQAKNNFPAPVGHYETIFRWKNNWKIVTPKGYSVLITHPHQRYDLPFTTMNGFIDTDNHINSIYLPFFLKENFEGVIPMGTPIAQIIPIKRDTWRSEIKLIPRAAGLGLKQIKQSFDRYYKTFIWQKKEYL